MEKKDAERIIPDAEFTKLLSLAKEGDKQALNNLLLLFNEDILHLSEYIRLPYEDAVQSIITDFIQFIKSK